MADRSKFEAMLELLVNEDKEGAEALFHEIVVEKSRDIYESLLEDEEVDESDDEVEEASDEEVDESDEDLDEADEEVEESDDDLEEGFDLDEFEVEADPMMGGDPADDMMGDMEPDMDGDDDMDMDGEGDVEDRVEDLEDALEDLKAEFEKMMAGDDEGDMDDEGDDDMDMDMDMDDEEPEEEAFTYESADEEVEEASDEEVEESDEDLEEGKMKDSLIGDSEKMSKAEFAKKHGKEAADEHYESAKTAGEQMREYVEKVAPAKHGDNGANTKSSVAGKNDMGGTTANILRADTEESGEAGAGTTIKGNPVQKQAPAAMNTKNINVPGGKAGKTSFKKKEPGHGAETRGKPETADKAAGSTLNKLSKRAK